MGQGTCCLAPMWKVLPLKTVPCEEPYSQLCNDGNACSVYQSFLLQRETPFFFILSFFIFWPELSSKGEEASLTLPWLIGMFYNWTLFIHKKNRRLWYCACSHQHVVTVTITDLPLLHHDSYYAIAIVIVFKTIVQLYFFVFFLQIYNTLFLL